MCEFIGWMYETLDKNSHHFIYEEVYNIRLNYISANTQI